MDPLAFNQAIQVIGQFRQLLKTNHINVQAVTTYIDKIKYDIYLLTQVLFASYKILMQQKTSLLQKINCVKFLMIMIETSDYVCIILIEVYLLGVLENIASNCSQVLNIIYHDSNVTEQQLSQCRKKSIQVIKVGSVIKPKDMYQNIQLSEPSLFAVSFHKIIDSSFIQPNLKKNYRSFLLNSQKFQEGTPIKQKFIKYFIQRTLQYIENGLVAESSSQKSTEFFNIKRMLRLGSYYINYDVLNICVDAIQNNYNICQKINALNLLNEMVIWGDLSALLIINYSDFLDNIFTHIYIDKNTYKIHKTIDNQQTLKQQYFKNLLRSVQLWARLSPYHNLIDNQNKNSLKAFEYDIKLKKLEQPTIIFPENPFLQTLQNQFNANVKLQNEKNTKIFENIQDRKIALNTQINLSYFHKLSASLQLELKSTIENTIKYLNSIISSLQNTEIRKNRPTLQANINTSLTQLQKSKKNIENNVGIRLNKDCSIDDYNQKILYLCSECILIIDSICVSGTDCLNKKIKLPQFHKKAKTSMEQLNSIKCKKNQYRLQQLEQHGLKNISISQIKKSNLKSVFEKIIIPSSDIINESEKFSTSHEIKKMPQLPLQKRSKFQGSQKKQQNPKINPQDSIKFATIYNNLTDQLLPLSNKRTQRAVEIAADRAFRIRASSPSILKSKSKKKSPRINISK